MGTTIKFTCPNCKHKTGVILTDPLHLQGGDTIGCVNCGWQCLIEEIKENTGFDDLHQFLKANK